MAVSKVTAWQSSDGRLFLNQGDAEDRERGLAKLREMCQPAPRPAIRRDVKLSVAAQNAVHCLLGGSLMFASRSPRLRREVVEELDAAGLLIQEEHGLHEPTVYTMLKPTEFGLRAKELGVWDGPMPMDIGARSVSSR